MHRALQGRCGLFCGDCEVYIAYSTNNTESQRTIAKATGENKGKALAPEQVKCLGCKGSMNSHWRTRCKIRECAEDKGMEFCYQCRQYPCQEMQSFLKTHSNAGENLRTISKIGPDAWLSMMLTRGKESKDESEV
jgi:hypothetical protein